MFNIAVLISGSGSNLNSIIQAVNSGELKARISAVISDNPDAFGLTRAENAGIPTYVIRKEPEKILYTLQKDPPDLIVLAGYLSILEKLIVNSYPGKIINIHPSLIPKYCGKGFYGERVHKAVLEAKEEKTGVTVHYVDNGIDTGEIIRQTEVPVLEDDSVESLQKRVLSYEHKILVDVIKELSQKK